MNNLDIVVCGSSRPQLLPYCVNSVKKFIISQSRDTNCRIIVHEDFVIPSESKKTVKWCNDNGIKVISSNPAIGYGKALYNLINNHVKTEYMMNLQDDWEFERTGIDIDRIIWTMKKHDIWSIIFNKRKNSAYRKDTFDEYDFNGLKLMLCDGWRMIPSVWNTSVVKRKFPDCKVKPESELINSFGNGAKRKDKKYCLNNVKSYYFGALTEHRWVKHTGNTWRKRDFNNRYSGGCIEWDILDLRDKPPWIPFYIRPMNKTWCGSRQPKEYFLKILNTFPEDIRKQFL